jgi:SAM-dependent methyltransferase
VALAGWLFHSPHISQPANMKALTQYIKVKWCKENIQSQYPHFNFQYVDLSNDLYKAKGIDPSTYSFNYEDKYFDFIFAISVFTHMIDSELENYVRQSARVIKENGILFATFFILSDDYKPDNQRFNFLMTMDIIV